jgi:hypothetical protein
MDNHSLDETISRESKVFQMLKPAAFIGLLILAIGMLVFLLEGGWLLILMLFIGDFCC